LRYLPRILETEGGAEQDIASVGVNGLGSFVLRLFTFRLLVVSMIVILTGIVFILLPSFDASLASSLGTINEFAPYLIIFLFAQSIINCFA
jgi:hypothetical protein